MPQNLTICATCAVETTDPAPEVCPICADERQYFPADGIQRWTTLGEVSGHGAHVEAVEREPGLVGLVLHGGVGIGQQGKIVLTEAGNVMVDVPGHVDDAILNLVAGLGGLAAIVPSHPHMYGSQSVWSDAFGAPVHIAAADSGWVQRVPALLNLWEGELEIVPGVRASQPGGHFPGSVVVHWEGRDGRGVLLTGDTIAPVPAAGWVSFMRSYPNRIPLSAAVVRRIADHVTSKYSFERLYGNFEGAVDRDARAAVLRSADRHARWVSGDYDDLT